MLVGLGVGVFPRKLCPSDDLSVVLDPSWTIFVFSWSEACLRDELMTGVLSASFLPLSRITIASLRDQGYEVDFSAADPFDASKLGTCPPCDGRRRRRAVATRQLRLTGDNGDDDDDDGTTNHRRRRRLSAAMEERATQFGQSILDANAALLGGRSGELLGVEFAADQVVSVVVQDGEDLFSVVVTAAP